MAKKCDHKSVGILVWKNGQLLIVERKKFPFGFAPPAGHVDDDVSFEKAVARELKEEVGLSVKSIELLVEGRKENKCRREDGGWHYWKIYEVEAEGVLKHNEEETKQVGWFDIEKLKALGLKTERYMKGEIQEKDWQESPGIESIWYEWFGQLKII